MPHLHFERTASTRRSHPILTFNFLRALLFALIFFLAVRVADCAFQWNDGAIEEILYYHNQFRHEQNIKENLKWSKNLHKKAQAYANQLSCVSFKHSQQDGCGENLANIQGSPKFLGNVTRLMRGWKHEPITGSVYNHATQMLWRETALVGCGVFLEGECMTLVCNYYPAGNFMSQTFNTSPEPCDVVPEEPTLNLEGNCRVMAASLQCDGAPRKKSGAGDGYAPGLPPRPKPPAGPPPPAKPPANLPPSYPPSSTSSTTGTATSTSTTSKASPKTSDVPAPAPKPPTGVLDDLMSSDYGATATKPTPPCSSAAAATGTVAYPPDIPLSSTIPSSTATPPSSSSAPTPSPSTCSCNVPKSVDKAAPSPMSAPPTPLEPESENGGQLTSFDDLSSGLLEASSEGAAVHRTSHADGLFYFQLICIFFYSVVLLL